MAHLYGIVTVALSVAMLSLMAGPVARTAAQTSEADAVKQVIQDSVNAIGAKNLDLLLSYIADDAHIDSRSAGKKVDKPQYREAMARTLPNIDSIQARNLKVTFTDPDNAIVDGEIYARGGGQNTAAYHQWRLQKRDGKWLIVETKYK